MNFHFLAGTRIGHLLKLLKNHKIHWTGKSLFRISSSVSWTLIMSPFNAIEKLLFGKKIAAQSLESPILIIGHPRSGTTFLHYIMSKDSQFGFCNIAQCFAPYSFKLTGQLTTFFFKRMLPEKRQMDNLKMSYDMPFEEEFAMGNLGEQSMAIGYYFPQKIYEHFRKSVLLETKEDKANWKKNWLWFLKKISWLTNKRKLLLKSPYNVARTNEILEIFPKAQFIYIYRDPINVYVSSKHLLRKSFPELALQKWNDALIQEFILKSYKETMTQYQQEKENIPLGQLLELDFNEVVNNPMNTIKNIYEHFNLNLTDVALEKIKIEISSYKNYKQNDLSISPEERKLLEIEWGDLINKL